MLFKIVTDNKKSLRERSVDISFPLSDEIKELGLNMLLYLKLSQDEDYLLKHKDIKSGVGLAAPQIGKNINLIAVYFINEENKEVKHVLINPKIISESTKLAYLSSGEGCLSVNKIHEGYVFRPYKITIKAYSLLLEKEVTFVAKGYEAIVLGHEIDHLKGILFYDHIDKLNPFKIREDSIRIN